MIPILCLKANDLFSEVILFVWPKLELQVGYGCKHTTTAHRQILFEIGVQLPSNVLNV
jgi:hypothetical protein